jgi:predicted DNA-binding protein
MGKKIHAVLRIGTTVDEELYKKLELIAQRLGRTYSDLLKEGIWDVIKSKENQEKEG